MKISIKQTLGLTAASCVALACSAIAAPPGGAGARGNSSFGMNQRTDLRTGSGNSSFGRTTAENARLRANDADDQDDQDVDRDNGKTKKTKSARHHTFTSYPGNSAFGRGQRMNHLRGSGNNIHGKTVSANAKLKHVNKKNND
ncbi:MAG: hypothetical protein DME97_06900 [Verrucomicrobia bacterium]|nr:MAG: hypothetical protein DME97_06900 [Verrucomicrobiota bacterium]